MLKEMKNLSARFITYLTEQVDTAPTWRSLLLRATLIHAPFLLLYVTAALVSIGRKTCARIATAATT